MAEGQRNEEELGALWEKSGGKGTYFTGTVCGQKVVVFKNDRKRADNHPDWRVLKARPKNAAPADDEEPPF